MKAPINNDNIYTVGTVIYARQNPTIKLVIKSYKARIYYCEAIDSERKTTKAYFEHELLANRQHFERLHAPYRYVKSASFFQRCVIVSQQRNVPLGEHNKNDYEKE